MDAVSAIIVTRGDVDLSPVLDSLPSSWEQIVWDNSVEQNLTVYGRYAAIERASHDLIYVQDDDVIVSNPQAITETWQATTVENPEALIICHIDDVHAVGRGEHVVCNMPQEFRHKFYEHHSLVGFGAAFHRNTPGRAFQRLFPHMPDPDPVGEWWGYSRRLENGKLLVIASSQLFRQRSDVVFTALTPRVLVDVPIESLPYASDPHRMWKQKNHQAERASVLRQVRKLC